MTKRRHQSGAFDPDYRRKGWNKSGFAPKNSNTSITQLSAMIASLVFFAQYLFPQTRNNIMTMSGLIPRAILAFCLWIALGLLFRKIAYIRFRRKVVASEPIIEFDKPEPPTSPVSLPAPINPKQFEHDVAQLLNILTDHKAVVVGGPGDQGIDIEVRNATNQLVGVVQCKNYDPNTTLPPGHIRDLFGAKQSRGVKTAYLFTTAKFSAESDMLAKEYGIQLIDGEEYSRWQIKARRKLLNTPRSDKP